MCTAELLYPRVSARARPSSLRARARCMQPLHRLESCTRLRTCCQEAIRLVVLASPSKFGTAAALWPSRRVSSKLRPREEVLDLIAGRSNDERRGPLPPSCRCSRGSVCKVSLFIYSALDRAKKCPKCPFTAQLALSRWKQDCALWPTVGWDHAGADKLPSTPEQTPPRLE